MKAMLTETKISALFFKKVDDPSWTNDKCYLPPELQYHVRIIEVTITTLSTRFRNVIIFLNIFQGEKTIKTRLDERQIASSEQRLLRPPLKRKQ